MYVKFYIRSFLDEGFGTLHAKRLLGLYKSNLTNQEEHDVSRGIVL